MIVLTELIYTHPRSEQKQYLYIYPTYFSYSKHVKVNDLYNLGVQARFSYFFLKMVPTHFSKPKHYLFSNKRSKLLFCCCFRRNFSGFLTSAIYRTLCHAIGCFFHQLLLSMLIFIPAYLSPASFFMLFNVIPHPSVSSHQVYS